MDFLRDFDTHTRDARVRYEQGYGMAAIHPEHGVFMGVETSGRICFKGLSDILTDGTPVPVAYDWRDFLTHMTFMRKDPRILECGFYQTVVSNADNMTTDKVHRSHAIKTDDGYMPAASIHTPNTALGRFARKMIAVRGPILCADYIRPVEGQPAAHPPIPPIDQYDFIGNIQRVPALRPNAGPGPMPPK